MDNSTWSLTLQTERLTLRPLQPGDYNAWLTGFSGRLPQQHRHDPGPMDLEGCDRTWFTNICAQHQQEALADQFYVFGVFHRETHQHLGTVDFATLCRDGYQWAIFGYVIHNQHWRQGYGKEAVRAALIAGFETLGYHRIEAAINLDNPASIALAESVGMRKECIRRGFIYENQQWTDHYIYVAFPSDFGLPEPPPQSGS